jgi:long-chain fatty acid transport protein
MKKTITVLALASVFAAGSAFASAYRIPEQSFDSTAKAGANIASAQHADASYFNPANMSWGENAWQVEVDAQYIHLSAIKYTDDRSSFYDGKTKTENFLLPTLFVESPDYSNFRIGFSITEPYGLAKRWDGVYPSTFAKKFELKVFEFNPTVSYKINKYVSVAAGARLLYSKAKYNTSGDLIGVAQKMDGDDTAYGYNVALSVRPDSNSNISVTYRSNVNLKLDGTADFSGAYGTSSADGKVKVPAPAVLAVSGAYTFFNNLTVELTWDRTYWSKYKNLDLNFDTTSPYTVIFGAPTAKNWKDSSAYRISVTYKTTPALDLMAGFAYDETPMPKDTLGFDLPDSDAYLFSLGGRYKITSQVSVGLGMLYDMKSNRSVNNLADGGHADGEFKNASALLVSAGLTYTF